ncbi:MAG: hypothetical protein KKI02_02615 [Planctomycetes bacterium]|nr:hypothetical protein [Planctomycetota bacterium]
MCRIPIAGMLLTVISLSFVTIAGCPLTDGDNGDGGDGSDTTPTTIVGTWSGTLSCTTTFSYPDHPGDPLPHSRDLTLTFDSEYLPSSLPIWGFNLAFDQRTTKNAEGESETLNFDANNPPGREITLIVTIAEATYSEFGASIVMNLQHSAESDELTEQGTGTMTIEATIAGSSLTFSGVAEYTVTQTTDQAALEATETITCTGTLTKR